MRRRRQKNTIDRVLIFCTAVLLIFTAIMTVIFCIYQSVPDTLIGAVFGAFGVETVNCVMLHKEKKKREERYYE